VTGTRAIGQRLDVVVEHAVGEHVAQRRARHAGQHRQIPRAEPDTRAVGAEDGDPCGRQQHSGDRAGARPAARDEGREGDDEAGLGPVQHRGDRGGDMGEADADRGVTDGRVEQARHGDPPQLAGRGPVTAFDEGDGPDSRRRGKQHDGEHGHDRQAGDRVLVGRVPQAPDDRSGDQGRSASPVPDDVPHGAPSPVLAVGGHLPTPKRR